MQQTPVQKFSRPATKPDQRQFKEFVLGPSDRNKKSQIIVNRRMEVDAHPFEHQVHVTDQHSHELKGIASC